MTSSFILANLEKTKDTWTYSLPGSPLGGLEDSYLRISGECHPDFVSVPIGHPTGTKMCIRKADHCGRSIGDTHHKQAKSIIENNQGYHRGSVNLYDTRADSPTQDWNPQYYADRRIPWESDLLRRDYIHWQIDFNGTGINTVRVPHQLRDSANRYFSYGYSFTPEEDPKTGNRVATSWSQTVPPPKWDLNQLYQPYTTFQREHEYVKHPQHFRDTKYFERIV